VISNQQQADTMYLPQSVCIKRIIVQPFQSSRQANSPARSNPSSAERRADAHDSDSNTTNPLSICNRNNTLVLKITNPNRHYNIRSQGRSVLPKPGLQRLSCCYPEICSSANVAACLLHRSLQRFTAREREKKCRMRPMKKGLEA
jgi:hypothetical protein